MNEELIIGRNPVLEALKSGRSINKVYVSEKMNENLLSQLERISQGSHTVIQKVPRKKIDQLTNGNHQGIAAYVASYEYATLENIFDLAHKKNEAPFFLILDELEDPHNLGSI